MAKIDIDTTNIDSVVNMLNDVIEVYNKSISVLDYTNLPYSFEKRYAYQNNYSSLKKDKEKLVELKNFVSDSIKEINSIDDALFNQAKNLPTNRIKDKDFSL